MPTDQSMTEPHQAVARRPSVFWLGMVIAAVCFAITAVLPAGHVQSGLAIFGGILFMAGAATQWRYRGQADQLQQLDEHARQLTEKDKDPVVLTDFGLVIQQLNPAAIAAFGHCEGRPIATLLQEMMANPSTLIDQVCRGLATDEAVKEVVHTRNGKIRFNVVQLSEDRMLWRIDDLGDDQPETAGDDITSELACLTVDQASAVIQMNSAAWRQIGQKPPRLTDFVNSPPFRAGVPLDLKTTKGVITRTCFEVEIPGKRRLIYLLPDGAAVRASNKGWAAVETLPLPLLKISVDGEILASNREARNLLNLEDTTDKRIADILDGLGQPLNNWLREAAEERSGHVSQFLRGRGANQDLIVQVTLNVSSDPGETHLIAIMNDVTEIKSLEAKFVQSQKMQAIGQLAGGVAHDFNNLLTAISGHCDLLLLRHDEGDQNYGDLIQIHQNANRAASLVGQLLAYSRKQNLQPEIIDLRDTLSDLTHLLNRLVGEKVTLGLQHDPALAHIKADKRQLEQVLMNLVVNARDAMPEGGEITVTTENLHLKEQMVKDRAVVPPGEYVVVRVADQGQGIGPDRLPKIFEPFYTTKRPGEGTGLGLSMAYGIVKQTGGYIFAESELGEGTRFSLLFPSYDLPVAEPLEVAPRQPQPISSNADGVVLLVEDEAPVRAFASRALRLRGYTVLEADCAEAALDLLADSSLNIDVFVTDVIMPGKDGPTWVREALVDRPNAKVVFVSGYAEDAFGDEKSRIPNSVFLPKPFSLNALTQTVQMQLENKAPSL